MEKFGLQYNSLDFIVDNEDKLIFLEVNPTGDRAYIEDFAGMSTTESLSKLIMVA